jgi:hypothetical protein
MRGSRDALLRSINVGGHMKVAMADLRNMITDLGFIEARLRTRGTHRPRAICPQYDCRPESLLAAD